MNISQLPDIAPSFCYAPKMFSSNQDILSAIKTAFALKATNKDFNTVILSYSFWQSLAVKISNHANFFGGFPKKTDNHFEIDEIHNQYIKHQFFQISQLVKCKPLVENKLYHHFSRPCKPFICNSEIELVCLKPEEEVHSSICTFALKKPYSMIHLSIPKEEKECALLWQGKPYSCVASNEEFMVVNWGDSQIYVFSGHERKFIKKLNFDDGNRELYNDTRTKDALTSAQMKDVALNCNGILQMEIRGESLYVKRKCDSKLILSIFSLKELENKPTEVIIPIKPTTLIQDQYAPLCFGNTRVIGTYIVDNVCKLISASYADLKKVINSEVNKVNDFSWQIDTLTIYTHTYYQGDKFCLGGNGHEYPAYSHFFSQGDNFVAVTEDLTTDLFDLTEIHFEDGKCFTTSIAKKISIYDPESSFKYYDAISYSNGHLIVAFNENMTNKISIFSVEKNFTTVVHEEEYTNEDRADLFPPTMLHSTALKTHYFTFSIEPLADFPERIGLCFSVNTLNFDSEKIPEKDSHF